MASAARSQAPASPSVSQPPPPPAKAVGAEQFDLLAQQVKGLVEAVQAMQQQPPQASAHPEGASPECQNPAVGRATWASRPVLPGKANSRVESPQSDHDSTPGRSLPPFCQRTLETRSREDFLDRRPEPEIWPRRPWTAGWMPCAEASGVD
uniref:Uncharacterized protein LOC114914234 n=1 Tax=Elaeis guineensis var. tenera TaxID=51953 RepID=A0A8N4IG82_ELAGV